MNDLSLRNDIKDYWKEATEGKEKYDPTVIADAALLHFKQDRAFCDQFLDAFLMPIIRLIGRDVAHQARNAAIEDRPQPMPRSIAAASSPAPLAPKPTPRDQSLSDPVAVVVNVSLAVDAQPSSDRWRRWQEVDPETGERVSLLSMTKRQLLGAADERAKTSLSSQRSEAMLRLIAGPLKHDDDVAGSYWSKKTKQLDVMFQDIEVERARFHLRSLMQGAAD